jgi:hypothetical protein
MSVLPSCGRHGFDAHNARASSRGWYTILGHRKISFVHQHSRADTDFRSAFAASEFQSSGNRFSRKLPRGACVSQKLTSPLA